MPLGSDLIGQRSETVRRANLAAIVRELHLRGPQSRSELVARTGLTRTAIRALIGELVAGDLYVEQRGAPVGSPGRPSPLVHPRAQRVLVLALAIAVDSLAAGLVGVGGTPVATVRIPRPRGHLSLEAIVDDLRGLVERLPMAHHRDQVVAIGVAMAGLVRRTDGTVSSAPNLGWRDAPLGERLPAALGLDVPIHVANEADLAAVAELRRGAARGADDLLLIWGEVGVGGGIVVDGDAMTGAAGYAGEVGHMPLNPAGTTCSCGSVGCWETEIGERALLRLAGRPVDGGPEEVDEVLRSAAEGEPGSLAALAHIGRWLGIGLAGLVNVLNPRVIVLGGLFARAYPYIETAIVAQLDRLALSGPRALVRIAPGALGIDAPLLGAAEL
ncbi:MAG TPA: ROK family protein, partial [Candidatus Limnocylindrales bacterium]|nr:ROK family protein [Candidatus Limnocylindrales bacterium]